METRKLNWQDLAEENVTNLYLYGDLNEHDLTSKEIHREGDANSADSVQVTIKLNNFYDYMTNDESPMRYANLSQIPVVEKFFKEEVDTFKQSPYPDISATPEMIHNFDALSEGKYSLDEVREHFDNVDKHYSLQHMELDPLSQDYDTRVYVFNSQAIHLGNTAQFVVKSNGERLIENAAPTISSENFDFVTKEPDQFLSKETLTNAGNDGYLVPNIDPLGIGRTVNISYPSYRDTNDTEYKDYIQDYAKAHGDYTQEKFESDLQRHEQEYSPVKGLANVLPAMSSVIDKLWESNTTKFLDKEGNVMLFEKEGLDSVYDGNSNMNEYMQEHTEVKYHLVEEDGTECLMDIPRHKEESQDKAEEKSNESTFTKEEIESLTVSNEQVEQLAKENERPITTYLNDMNEQMANQDQNDSGRTLADDYASMRDD